MTSSRAGRCCRPLDRRCHGWNLLLFFLFFSPFATDAKSAVRMNCSCSRSVTLSRPEAAAERQPNTRDGVDQSVKRIYKRTGRGSGTNNKCLSTFSKRKRRCPQRRHKLVAKYSKSLSTTSSKWMRCDLLESQVHKVALSSTKKFRLLTFGAA